MSATHASIEDHHEPGLYEIRIKGHLDNRWADWFEGLAITLEDNGDTLLTGPVVDQAALHGLLRKVRDIGMPLVSFVQSNKTCQLQSKKEHKDEFNARSAAGHRIRGSSGDHYEGIVQDKYGSPDVLELQEVDQPEPLDDEVLVQVHGGGGQHGRLDRPDGQAVRGAPRPQHPRQRTALDDR